MHILKERKWKFFKTPRNFKCLWMSPKIADHNRTDTNSYTCDDLYRVYIFHKLSSQHSICTTRSDVCKLDSSQFIYNFTFILYIIRVTTKHHRRYTGFLSSTPQDTVLVTCRQLKTHSSKFFLSFGPHSKISRLPVLYNISLCQASVF